MKITLERVNDQYAVEATNEAGHKTIIDGGGSALSPMQSLLSAVAACTVVDIVEILKKQKQQLQDIKMEIEGEREELELIKPFKAIHLHYKLYGDIDEKKANKAVYLAYKKYCSVSASLSSSIDKTYTVEIIND